MDNYFLDIFLKISSQMTNQNENKNIYHNHSDHTVQLPTISITWFQQLKFELCKSWYPMNDYQSHPNKCTRQILILITTCVLTLTHTIYPSNCNPKCVIPIIKCSLECEMAN